MKRGKVVIQSLGLETGKPTANGRIYTEECLAKAVRDFNKKCKVKRGLAVFGSVKGQDLFYNGISLSSVVGVVDKVFLKKRKFLAQVKILDVPKAKDLIKNGMVMGPLGFGNVDGDGVVHNFNMVGVGVFPKEVK